MNKLEVSEQIQQDILSYVESIDPNYDYFNDQILDNLCQIVVDNISKLDS